MAYADMALSAQVAADGTAMITVRVSNGIGRWTVTQVSTEMGSAPIGSTCELRKNGSMVTPMIATGDVAGGDPPVVLNAADALTVSWAGCTPGDVASAFVIYDDGRADA